MYRPSVKPYPVKLPALEYGSDVTVRYVRPNGEIRWRGELLYVSHVLAKDHIALKQIDETVWEIHYSFHGWAYLMSELEPSAPLIDGMQIPDDV